MANPSPRRALVPRACCLVLLAVPIAGGSRSVEARGFSRYDAPALVEHYGSEALQIGELRLPRGKGPFPVAVIFHGGCYTRESGSLRDTVQLAEELANHGVATWNVGFRQVGDTGGGWPGTFQDWGAAIDHLRELATRQPLDLDRVVAVGHGGGATAALWSAARVKLPTDSPIRGADPLAIGAAVALDGPVDLADFDIRDAATCGGDAVGLLLGGSPSERAERYAQTSPRALLPIGIPQAIVTSSMLAPQAAVAYRNAGRAAGDDVTLTASDSIGNAELVVMRPGPSPGHRALDLVLQLVPPKTGRFRYLP